MLRRLRKDQRGVAAVEFALIAPLLILVYFGLVELTTAMLAQRRATHAASVVGDLVAQTKQINATQMTDIFQVANAILAPFPTTSLQMRVSSVTADSSGNPKVDWSQGVAWGAYGAGAGVSMPAGLLAAGDSIIMTEVKYSYTSPLHMVIPTALPFSDVYYLKPRKSPQVVWVAG